MEKIKESYDMKYIFKWIDKVELVKQTVYKNT